MKKRVLAIITMALMVVSMTACSIVNETTISENSQNYDTWCDRKQIDNIIYVTYNKGISDDYMITEKGSFGDMCDWPEYAVPGYPTETFRKVFSLFFTDQEFFEECTQKVDEEQRNVAFALLASISWQIDHDGAVVNNLHRIVGENTLYSFEVSAKDTGDYIFQWNVNTNDLAIGKDDDRLVDYQTTVFDRTYIAAYMIAIEEALNGTPVEVSSTSN